MHALELPTRSEIDAQIEQAAQTRMRHGYSTPAVVILSGLVESRPRLGFFFEAGRRPGELSIFKDGTLYFVLAVVE